MKISILGTGVVGQTISEKLFLLGHEVMIGTRNVENLMAKTGPNNYGRPPFSEWHRKNAGIKVTTFSEAASFGELIVNATNGFGTLPALESAGRKNLSGKVLLDISNPLDFSKGMPPTLFVSNTDSLGEQIQRNYPELKVVKSLNTVTAAVMVNPDIIPGDHIIYVNGNDQDAKTEVRKILMSFGWKEKNIIDLGDITASRGVEQILPVWVRLMGLLKTPLFNFNIVTGNPPKN